MCTNITLRSIHFLLICLYSDTTLWLIFLQNFLLQRFDSEVPDPKSVSICLLKHRPRLPFRTRVGMTSMILLKSWIKTYFLCIDILTFISNITTIPPRIYDTTNYSLTFVRHSGSQRG